MSQLLITFFESREKVQTFLTSKVMRIPPNLTCNERVVKKRICLLFWIWFIGRSGTDCFSKRRFANKQKIRHQRFSQTLQSDLNLKRKRLWQTHALYLPGTTRFTVYLRVSRLSVGCFQVYKCNAKLINICTSWKTNLNIISTS